VRGNNPLAKGQKPERFALVAIMRKIITTTNARLREAETQQT